MKPVTVAVFRPRLATCAFVLVRCLQYWFLVLFFREKKSKEAARVRCRLPGRRTSCHCATLRRHLHLILELDS